MLTPIKKILHYLSYVLRSTKVWKSPRRCDVLIYDDCNSQILKQYLSKWEIEILHVRGESVNIPILLKSFLRSGNKTDAYRDCYIEAVNPRLIVTMIDNSVPFYFLKSRHPEVKTLFIQNGLRGYYGQVFEVLDQLSPEDRQQIRVDVMLTFGKIIGDKYAQYLRGEIIPIGSLRNNLVQRTNGATEGIVYVSQWSEGLISAGIATYTQAQVDGPIVKFLADYCQRKGKKLSIIPRTTVENPDREKEKEHFSSLIGKDCVFTQTNSPHASYQAIDLAEVVVTLDSTLGYEAIARGKKAAIFSIRTDILGVPGITYAWPGDLPPEGLFWTNYLNINSFERIIEYLLRVDYAQWYNDVESTGFSSVMTYDPGNARLLSVLERELGHHERTNGISS